MTRDTEQEVNPCKFVSGACIHCEATERGDCQGWVSSPKREWQGLTDEERNSLWRNNAPIPLMKAIEAKLKGKNT